MCAAVAGVGSWQGGSNEADSATHLRCGCDEAHLVHVAAEEHYLRPAPLDSVAAEDFRDEEAELAVAHDGDLVGRRDQALPPHARTRRRVGRRGVDGRS